MLLGSLEFASKTRIDREHQRLYRELGRKPWHL